MSKVTHKSTAYRAERQEVFRYQRATRVKMMKDPYTQALNEPQIVLSCARSAKCSISLPRNLVIDRIG